MFQRFGPVLNQWYETNEGASFEVVAYDEADQLVEIQHLDGAIEELDLDSWFQLAAKPRAEPDNWSSPFDDLEPEDQIPDDDEVFHPSASWEEQVDGME